MKDKRKTKKPKKELLILEGKKWHLKLHQGIYLPYTPFISGSILVLLGLILLCLIQILRVGLDLRRWDFLLLSGTATLAFGIWKVQEIDKKLENTLTLLFNRKTLITTPEKLKAFQINLKTQANAWARISGLIAGTAMLIAFLDAYLRPPFLLGRVILTFLEVVGAYIAGRYLGQMACYGFLKLMLQRNQIGLKVKPGHLDGVSGLKPIGNFYFFQAMITALPAIFLFVWLLIFPFCSRYEEWSCSQYEDWRRPYLGLLAIAIAYEILAFVLPLWLFHEEMAKQKQALLEEADIWSYKIDEIRNQLAIAKTSEEREILKERLSVLTKRYLDIEQMFTWPVDIQTIIKFASTNATLSIPLFIDLAQLIQNITSESSTS